jgi:Xaa-Pro aminopeptidase
MEKENLRYLTELRKVMTERGIYATIITGTDPHQSELPPHHWRGREWLTGFWSENGTNGTAVVTPDAALCWTDSRYFIQATQQLEGTGFEMMKLDGPDAVDLIDWVAEHVPAGKTVAIDGTTFSVAMAGILEGRLAGNKIKLDVNFPMFDYIYHNRPARPLNPLFIHDEAIVGESADSKLNRIMEEVRKEEADAIMISSLDDIAWATNLRTAGDIAFSPIFVGYLYIDATRRVLFIDSAKVNDEVKAHLAKYRIEQRPYDEIFTFTANIPKETRLLLDPQKTSRTLYDSATCKRVFGGDGVARLKSIKNASMLASVKKAMLKDGVALTKFFMMVEREYPEGKLTELELGKRLRALRLADPACVDESFAPIIGWNEHGAIVHYEATEESSIPVVGDGLLLVDSGGQYLEGTTDITRTIALGTPTAEQIHDFTLVLKGHIALSNAVYPEGTRGAQLDALARQFLWAEGKAYYHGTGHGVGFFINCHEGPQTIRLNNTPAPLEVGMITSDEPGLYLEGEYGIRIENVVATMPYKETEFGKFLHFENLTLFPIDTRLIETAIMTDSELRWLNDYHAEVRAKLLPYLNEEEAAWMIEKTEPITK